MIIVHVPIYKNILHDGIKLLKTNKVINETWNTLRKVVAEKIVLIPLYSCSLSMVYSTNAFGW